MARTHRAHLSYSKLAKRGGQPKVRSAVALAAIESSGAGVHTKSHKQRRANERAALRKEFL